MGMSQQYMYMYMYIMHTCTLYKYVHVWRQWPGNYAPPPPTCPTTVANAMGSNSPQHHIIALNAGGVNYAKCCYYMYMYMYHP